MLEQEVGEALLASLLAVSSDGDPPARRAASALYAGLLILRATTATMRGELPAIAGLADVVARYAERHGLAVTTEIDLDEGRLDREDRIALVGIVCEAFENAVRPGNACTVQVTAARGRNGIRMVIEDEDSGVTPADPEHAWGDLGIAGVEGLAVWRRGTVTLSASSGGGLRLEVALPGPPE